MEKCGAGAGAGNKCKKEKREQTFHVCSSNASKGNLYLRINGSWATFYYLHLCNLANSKRAMYLLEGKKKWPFLLVLRTPISFLSPASWAVSFTLHTEPAAPVPRTFRVEVYDFLYNTNTEMVLPGGQEQVLLFSQSIAIGSVGATQDFCHFQKECFV